MTKDIRPNLVLNSDGSLYHINLLPGDVAKDIILVGDPGRVKLIGGFFDSIEVDKHNREIHTLTGYYKGKRITVMSSGMGTDNIEIVVNELDALFNINLEKAIPVQDKTSLNLIRIGTSGALQPEIPVVESFLVSEYGLGLDGLAYFYKEASGIIESNLTGNFIDYMKWDQKLPTPYGVKGSVQLLESIGKEWSKGITLTAPGFYAPQGRELRLKVNDDTIIDRAQQFVFNNSMVTNFEMETSALYVLSAMLGHNALTVCNIIANRVTGEFDPDYKKSMKILVEEVLDRIVELK